MLIPKADNDQRQSCALCHGFRGVTVGPQLTFDLDHGVLWALLLQRTAPIGVFWAFRVLTPGSHDHSLLSPDSWSLD